MSHEEQTDLRIRRTHKFLQEAMIELITEKGFDAITVGDIAERAMINRATFYRHYQDKYDLVEHIVEEAMNTLFEAIDELGQDHPADVWIRFFEQIAQYDRLYRALLGKKGSPWFVRKMRTSLAGLVKERRRLPHGPDASTRLVHTFSDEFVPDLVSAMFVEAITWWLEQGRPYTPKEIATRTALLASALFKEASTW